MIIPFVLFPWNGSGRIVGCSQFAWSGGCQSDVNLRDLFSPAADFEVGTIGRPRMKEPSMNSLAQPLGARYHLTAWLM
jgi:hypothetical protein